MAEESVVELVLTAALLTLGLLVARDFRGWIRLGGVLLVLLALLWSVEPITRLLH